MTRKLGTFNLELGTDSKGLTIEKTKQEVEEC